MYKNNNLRFLEEYVYNTKKLSFLAIITFGAVIAVCFCGALICGFCTTGDDVKPKYVSHA